MRDQEGTKPERSPVPAGMRERHIRLGMIGFVAEDVLDAGSELVGLVGVGQTGLGVGLDRRRSGEETVAAHQSALRVVSALTPSVWVRIAA